MPQAQPFFRPALILATVLLGAGLVLRGLPSAAESARSIPAPVLDEPSDPQATSEVAILAGGCFWGVQGVFQHVEGVTSAVSGYAGGAANTAHYEMVGTNTTGHAESVQVTFDLRRISYGHILQARIAEAYIAQLNQGNTFNASIVTKVEPGRSFYPAEGYHQDFLTRNPTYPYIVANDLPKIEALKRLFPNLYRATPVLVAAAAPRS